jgi:hypothetical protein
VSYQPAGPFALAVGYATSGVAFRLNGAGATQFYANFSVTPDLTFSAAFVVTMVYSDDINETDQNLGTSFVVTVATATATGVAPPNASLSLAGIMIAVDASYVVQSVTGSAALTQGPIVAQSYVIDLGTLGLSPTYAAVDAVFNSPAKTRVALTGASQAINANSLGLVGAALATPQLRDIILANTVSGVTSYQLFQITVESPSGSVPQTTPPSVSSTTPLNAATGVASSTTVIATFSEAMNPTTLNTATFTLKRGSASVAGAVTCKGATATFTPTQSLTTAALYTATITTGSADLFGNALPANYSWNFTTGPAPAGPTVVDLGTAANFAILATSGVSIGAAGAVTGNVGLSPMSSAGLTGFSIVPDVSGLFATSPLVTGLVYSADDAAPTPANLAAAVADLQAAYTDAAGRTSPDARNLGGGDLGGLTIVPGLYAFSTAVVVTTDVTLSGGPNDVWIFQVGAALSMTAQIKMHLTGGAQARNISWTTLGAVALGAGAHLEGDVLSKAAISMGAGASVNGRLLGQTVVALGAGATVAQPSP